MRASIFRFLLVIGTLALSTFSLEAQAPSSIAGRAVNLTIAAGNGPFASSGVYRFLASAMDNSYGVIAISGSVRDSYGTDTYAASGSIGTVNFTDSAIGVPAVTSLTFTTALTGTFYTTIPSSPGISQQGTFSVYSGQGPTSVVGWSFNLTINYGNPPFASSGTAELVPATSGNTYQITGSPGVTSSSGTYVYALVSTSTSSLALNDSVFGSAYTQTLSWDTPTTGAYVARNSSTGGVQAGTFVATPPAPFTTSSDGNGGLIVTGYTGAANASVIIPSTIGGETVTAISASAFSGQTLTTVLIPSTVSSMGQPPFPGNLSLTSITVDPANPSFTSVNGVLFDKNQTKILQYPAAKTGQLYTIPATVNLISSKAFRNAENLINVTIPSSVTSIGDFAFADCVSLNTAPIPTGVRAIGQEAFGDTNLLNVTIPATVTSIGDGAFLLCRILKSFTVDPANPNYSSSDDVLFDKNQTTLIQYPEDRPGASYTIPNTVTTIGDDAIYVCNNLTTVVIPNSVSSIGAGAFYQCLYLSSITIPGSVTIIGQEAFGMCNELASVNLSNGLTTIATGAFQECNRLTSITIPSTVTTMGYDVF